MYKYLDKSSTLIQGLLKQTFQKTQSTKSLLPLIDSNEEARVRTGIFITKLITIPGKITTDQTGRLPFQSSLGTQYFMMCYVYDSNEIISIALK